LIHKTITHHNIGEIEYEISIISLLFPFLLLLI
jgi:hypothetical protein